MAHYQLFHVAIFLKAYYGISLAQSCRFARFSYTTSVARTYYLRRFRIPHLAFALTRYKSGPLRDEISHEIENSLLPLTYLWIEYLSSSHYLANDTLQNDFLTWCACYFFIFLFIDIDALSRITPRFAARERDYTVAPHRRRARLSWGKCASKIHLGLIFLHSWQISSPRRNIISSGYEKEAAVAEDFSFSTLMLIW